MLVDEINQSQVVEIVVKKCFETCSNENSTLEKQNQKYIKNNYDKTKKLISYINDII